MQPMDYKPEAEESEKDKSKDDDLGGVEDCRQPLDAGEEQQGQQQSELSTNRNVSAPLRDSTPPSQVLSPTSSPLRPPNLARRLRRQAARLRHSIEVANRRFERRCLQLQSLQRQRDGSTTERGEATNITSTIGNPAVRALFREHSQQQQQVRGVFPDSMVQSYSGNTVNSSSRSDSIGEQHMVATHPITMRQQAVVVEANRRLIERQIDAIREADGRRWNFDFSNCRPLNQSNHRYYGHQPQRCLRSNRSERSNDDNNNEIIFRDEDDDGDQCLTSENDNANHNDLQQHANPMARGNRSRNFKSSNGRKTQNRDS